jgi:hypothetical protein
MTGAGLTAGERKDLTALQLIRDVSVCTRGLVDKETGKATRQRLIRGGYVTGDADSEYSDALALTWDGIDYLAVLEELS